MAWYSREADDSYRLLGGLGLALVVFVMAFLADIFTDKQYITPEALHAIIGFVSGAVMMSGRNQGSKNGDAQVSMQQPEQPKPTAKPTRKPFRRVD